MGYEKNYAEDVTEKISVSPVPVPPPPPPAARGQYRHARFRHGGLLGRTSLDTKYAE